VGDVEKVELPLGAVSAADADVAAGSVPAVGPGGGVLAAMSGVGAG
jgi:hypothetical protein